MASCRAMQEKLTAWVDGELSPRWDARLRQHVAVCTACAAAAAAIRAAVAWQRRCLPEVVRPVGLDPALLRGRLRQALAAEPDVPDRSWVWLLRPLAIGGAAVAVATAVLFFVAGGPGAVLIPLGVESPPAAVAREPDLFKDYQLIQHLDALENFDTVESIPLDDDQGAHRG